MSLSINAKNSIARTTVKELLASLSVSGGGIVTTTFADNYSARGHGFDISLTLSIPKTTPYYMVFDTSALTARERVITLPMSFASSQGPVKIRTYNATSYIGGTTAIINPGNEIANNTPESVFKYGVTSVVGSTNIRNYLLGISGNPVTSRGGNASSSNPLNMGKARKVIEVVNNYSDNADFNINFSWFEI